MVQRSPEARAVWVRKRDGRRVPFDQARLFASIRHALEASGSEDPYLAADLGSVVEAYVTTHVADGSISAEEIASLVQQVMASAGCETGAYVYQRVREERNRARHELRIRHHDGGDGVRAIPRAGGRAPDEWSKGRIVAMLEAEAELPVELAQEIAAEVERGLFASGVGSVSCGLVREWVDNELVKRGLRARLGRHQQIALSSHEVRDVLAARGGGWGAEADLAGRVLARYALLEVYPRTVVRAHEKGRICLEGLDHAGRVDTVAITAGALRGAGRRSDIAAGLAPSATPAPPEAELARLAGRVRGIRGLCSREVLLVWDLAAPSVGAAETLLLGLADAAGAPVTVCVGCGGGPADGAAAAALLEACERLLDDPELRRWPLPALRLCAPGPGLLGRAVALESADGRVQLAACAPEPGITTSAVAVNLPRLVLDGPSPGLAEGLDQGLTVARSACRARAALLDRDGEVLAALARAMGTSELRLGPFRRRIDLCGRTDALALAAREPLARDELVSVMAEVLGRHLGEPPRSHPGARVRPGETEQLELGPASPAAGRRLGRLDLGAHPDARDRLPLDARRDGFRYDGPEEIAPADDAAALGARAGREAARLGWPAWHPVPRSTGGDAARAAFVSAYLQAVTERAAPAPREEQPCA